MIRRLSTSACSAAARRPGSVSIAPGSEREFVVDFALILEDGALPPNELPPDQRDRDLGWMLHDIDFANSAAASFFRARLADGFLNVARYVAEGLAR
jgi:CRISPR-associated protein Cas5d